MCMQLVPTVLEYAGQKVRGGGELFDADTPTPIAITKKFFKGLKGIAGYYFSSSLPLSFPTVTQLIGHWEQFPIYKDPTRAILECFSPRCMYFGDVACLMKAICSTFRVFVSAGSR